MIRGIRDLLGSQIDLRRDRSTVWLTWPALAVIILLQAQPFTYGYLRSADEVVFLAASFGGWRSVEELTNVLAVTQGRLGFLAAIPLNILGAYLADDHLARWIFVLLHFGMFALFAGYFSIISATKVARALLIVLITLQTIGGIHDYMPPISYPLQNTLPFIALLVARCTILLVQPHRRGASYVLWPARIVFLLAIMTTEYAFLLATALLAAEYSFALARSWRRCPSLVEALLGVVKQRTFLYDVLFVVLALAAYVVYRRLHPSAYVGNVIDAGFEVGRVVETTMRHVLAGTVFTHGFFDMMSPPREALPMAVLVGILTAACLFAVLHGVRELPSPLAIASASVLAVAYVTFPLAGNARQQVWCLENGACGWLDSRSSYLGFAVIVICMIALVLRYMPTYRATMAAVAVISVATGLIATTTYARNLRDGRDMMPAAWAWERAALLACYPEEQPAANHRLLRVIDPDRRVRFHPGSDEARFWRDYMRFVREDGQCPPDKAARRAELRRVKEFGLVAFTGDTIHFRDRSANQFLGAGWSQPEAWGIWSDAERASIVFLPRFAPGAEGLQLRLTFRPYIRPSIGRQTISVSVNGRLADTWTITEEMEDKDCCERTIALGRELNPAEEVDITFHLHDPRDPETDREIVDSRRLGVFLQSMTLTGSSDKGR